MIDKAIIALKGGTIDWLPDGEKPKKIDMNDWMMEIDKTITTGKGKKAIIKDSYYFTQISGNSP